MSEVRNLHPDPKCLKARGTWEGSSSANGWVAAKVTDDNAGNHTITMQRGQFTLCEVGCYTPDDWEKLYAAYQQGVIEYPWVAGPRDVIMAGEKGPWEL